MREIGTRLGKGADAIKRRHRGMTKATELWKYKPHPMAPLTAGPQFRQKTAGKTGICAVTKRSRSNGSAPLIAQPPGPSFVALCSIGKLDPGGGMIAGFIPPPHAAIDLRPYEALAERWAQQQMVDPQSGISG